MSEKIRPEDDQTLTARSARAFDAELHTAEYRTTHADAVQLKRLIKLLKPVAGQRVLDLGTGAGYVALAIAGQYPMAEVTGLDIARQALRKDAVAAAENGYKNLSFVAYDGVTLPFRPAAFERVITRYAFHHFPRPETTVSEISRTTSATGRLVLCDAVRHEVDQTDFVNRFQNLKPDGHVEMLRTGALVDLLDRCGFELESSFPSSISFQRKTSGQYEALMKSTPSVTLDAYRVSVAGDQIDITLPIFSAVFTRKSTS